MRNCLPGILSAINPHVEPRYLWVFLANAILDFFQQTRNRIQLRLKEIEIPSHMPSGNNKRMKSRYRELISDREA